MEIFYLQFKDIKLYNFIKKGTKAKIKRNKRGGRGQMSNLNLKGLWIPIEILTDTNLSDKEKHIYSIIMFLNKEHHRQLLYIKIIKVEIFEKYLLLLLSQTTRFWGTRLQSWIAMSGQVLISAWKFETEQGFIKSRKNLKNVFLDFFFYLNCKMRI